MMLCHIFPVDDSANKYFRDWKLHQGFGHDEEIKTAES